MRDYRNRLLLADWNRTVGHTGEDQTVCVRLTYSQWLGVFSQAENLKFRTRYYNQPLDTVSELNRKAGEYAEKVLVALAELFDCSGVENVYDLRIRCDDLGYARLELIENGAEKTSIILDTIPNIANDAIGLSVTDGVLGVNRQSCDGLSEVEIDSVPLPLKYYRLDGDCQQICLSESDALNSGGCVTLANCYADEPPFDAPDGEPPFAPPEPSRWKHCADFPRGDPSLFASVNTYGNFDNLDGWNFKNQRYQENPDLYKQVLMLKTPGAWPAGADLTVVTMYWSRTIANLADRYWIALEVAPYGVVKSWELPGSVGIHELKWTGYLADVSAIGVQGSCPEISTSFNAPTPQLRKVEFGGAGNDPYAGFYPPC